MSIENRVVHPSECAAAWDRFVDKHPKGSIFHTSAMSCVFENARRHRSHMVGATNYEGKLLAILPAVHVETIGGMASRLASRSICYAEPICEDSAEGEAALQQLLASHHTNNAHRVLYGEIRALDDPCGEQSAILSQGYLHEDYLNYIVNTAKSEEQLWQQLRPSLRKKIRQSQRRGVKVEVDNTEAGVERMYRLVAHSYRRNSVPLAHRSLFAEALDRLPIGSVQIRIATHLGEDVASGIGLVFGGRFYAWYGGTLRDPAIAPFACLTWDEIRWASEHGLSCYDFGGGGWPGDDYGPRFFKQKFGSEEVNYGRYTKVFSPFRLAIAESAYNSFKKLILN